MFEAIDRQNHNPGAPVPPGQPALAAGADVDRAPSENASIAGSSSAFVRTDLSNLVAMPFGDAHISTFRGARFAPDIVRVTDRVYCATGFALSNVIMIAVDGGKVIVDTTEKLSAAREIRARFDALVPGPIHAIIYTHCHPDHVFGATAFQDGDVPIWAHVRTKREMCEQFGGLARSYRERGSRMYGETLSDDLMGAHAIGPRLRFDPGPVPPVLMPSHTFAGTKALEIGGIRIELHEAPGETLDHIFVWLPEDRTLLPADNIYRAFPNLSSIRGAPPRPVKDWISSLDKMRELVPEHLVPGHTEPVSGARRIQELLRTYRDGIAYVHDAVIAGANEGKPLHDLVRDVRLPRHLAEHPYLQETYGKVSWSVRGIYHGYFGWFDGNPTNLSKLHPAEFARIVVPMMGGADAVIEHARKLLVTGSLHDAQAAAELLDLVLAIEPSNGAAEAHKARAIEALGHGATNQNARGYLLSSALEMQGKIAPPIKPTVTPSTIRELPIDVILLSLPERLDPVRSRKAVMTVGFEFFDTKRHFYFAVRNGVAEVREQTAIDADLIVRASEADFKNFLLDARPLSRLVALVRGKVSLSGGWGFLHNLVKFQRFGSLITPP